MMLIGQPFAFAGGWGLVWTRLFYAERIAKRFKDARAAGVLRVRHRFRDAYEVEICARYEVQIMLCQVIPLQIISVLGEVSGNFC